jgi:hypothetical protein
VDYTEAYDAVVALWRTRAWEVLGYESWEHMCENEFPLNARLRGDGK